MSFSCDEMMKIVRVYGLIHPEEEHTTRRALCILRNGGQQFWDPQMMTGHFTASGIILAAKTKAVVLVYHPTLKCLLQPGGHMRYGENPLETAQREIDEETGLQQIQQVTSQKQLIPIDIDVHRIPENAMKNIPEHDHVDCRYGFIINEHSTMNNKHGARLVPIGLVNCQHVSRALCRALGKVLQVVRGSR
jgi:8-oxo-dGTP pyrophosphatase MutT (NUDIX family)